MSNYVLGSGPIAGVVGAIAFTVLGVANGGTGLSSVGAAGTVLTSTGTAMAWQVSPAVTSLTGDVTASGPGAAAATVVALQGNPVSATAPTTGLAFIWSGSAYQTSALNLGLAGAVTGFLAVARIIPSTVTGQVLTTTSGSSTVAWATPASGGISALTGDTTASGSGSVTTTTVSAQSGAVTFGANSGTNYAQIAFVSSQAGLWLGTSVTASTSNVTLMSTSGGAAALVNGTSSSGLAVNGTGILGVTASTILLTVSNLDFSASTTPLITQLSTTGATPATMTITPQVSTNASAQGSNLNINLGAPVTAGTNEGFLTLQRGGTTFMTFGSTPFPGAVQPAIYMGNVTPSNSNFSIRLNSNQLQFNGPSGFALLVGGAYGVYMPTSSDFEMNGNIDVGGNSGSPAYGGGFGVLRLENGTAPTTNIGTGSNLFSDAIGAHAWMPSASSGLDYMLAPVLQGTPSSQLLKKREYGGVVRTTSATATTLITIPVATSASLETFRVIVSGRDVTSGTVGDGVSFDVLYQFKNVGGTVTAATGTASVTMGKVFDTSMTSCALTATVSGTNVLIQVTGLASVTIDWTGFALAVVN